MVSMNAFCMMCGTPLEPGFRFCARCGAAIPEQAAEVQVPAPAPAAAPASPPVGDPSSQPVAAPVASWEELQQTRAIEFIECALADAVAESKGWFDPTHFSELITKEVVRYLRPLDRVDLFVPAVIEVGCAQESVAGADRVKATGELTPGLIVARDEDVILAWASGVLRFKTGSIVIPYGSVQSASPFTLRAKLATLPAAEVMTSGGRFAFTFSNNLHDDAGADPTGWRDTLVDRFNGSTPVFEEYRVVSRTRPPGPAAAAALPTSTGADGAWHPDPWRVATYRWHDGTDWTEHVS